MSSNLYSSGVANIWVDGNSSTSLTFLGVCEDECEITNTAKYKVVNADYAGGSDGVPADMSYLGQMLSVKMTISRMTLATVESLQARLTTPSTSQGQGLYTDIGTLMVTSGQAFRLLIYPQGYATNNSLQIFNFPNNAILDGDIVLNYSTRNLKAQLLFTVIPAWQANGSNGYSWTLWNNSTTGMGVVS